MARKYAQLTHIEHNEPITKETHYEFLFHLQNALLIALREQGNLSPMAYHHAEEKLKSQRIRRAGNLLKGEGL